jgi:hypothetical protein
MHIHGLIFKSRFFSDQFTLKDTIHSHFLEKCDQESVKYYEDSMKIYKEEHNKRIKNGDMTSKMQEPVPPIRKYPK